MKRHLLNTFILAASIVPSVVMAADTPAKMPVPTVSDILDASGINVSGYIDVAFNQMNSTGLFVGANGPVSSGLPGNTHIFDTPGARPGQKFSSYNLHQIALLISKQPKEGFGGTVNFATGQDAATIASTGFGVSGVENSSHMFDLIQSYISYSTGALTIIGGKFPTLAGVETIASPPNKHFTHAWMFGWGPYTHTGLRATYVANDKITLIAGINNGWDQVTSTTSTRTEELGLVLAPFSMFSLATSYYRGEERAAGIGARNYLDMIGTFTINDKLNFVLNYAKGSQKNAITLGDQAKWNALALYANYQINDTWRAAYRHETFDDKNGFRSNLLTGVGGTTLGQKLTSNTVTIGYAVDKKLEFRGEIRLDESTVNAFLQSDNTANKNQLSYGVQAIYQF